MKAHEFKMDGVLYKVWPFFANDALELRLQIMRDLGGELTLEKALLACVVLSKFAHPIGEATINQPQDLCSRIQLGAAVAGALFPNPWEESAEAVAGLHEDMMSRIRDALGDGSEPPDSCH